MKMCTLLFVLAACGGTVPRGTPPDTATPACFSFTYTAKGRSLVGRACWQEQRICAEAARLVVKHGRVARVTSVGDCEVE